MWVRRVNAAVAVGVPPQYRMGPTHHLRLRSDQSSNALLRSPRRRLQPRTIQMPAPNSVLILLF
ncbi:hypothetical protein Csa_010196 [Cucumis sativus]|uniref:Uncharacterized protein n=1 Tax=Cucumis sativus TaxID=3659 RepID=A0A0A0L990_CUCSA|nr:hypothetical protein Csa_010196 [Cucumis sativus]